MVDIAKAKKALEGAQREYEKAVDVKRKKLLKLRDEIDAQIAELEGAPQPVRSQASKRRSGVKQTVFGLIKKHGKLTKADIVNGLHAKKDPSYVNSISAALAILKKEGTITQDNNRNYIVPVPAPLLAAGV
jgi:hypothetical protein